MYYIDKHTGCEDSIKKHLPEIIRRAKGLQREWVEVQADYVWEEWLEDFRRNGERRGWIPTDDVPYDEFFEELYDGLDVDCDFADFVNNLVFFDEVYDLVAEAYGKVADIVRERIENYLDENGYKWYIRGGEYRIEKE